MSDAVVHEADRSMSTATEPLGMTRRNWWVNLNLGLLLLFVERPLADHPPAVLGWVMWSVAAVAFVFYGIRVRTVVVVDPKAGRVTVTRYGIRRSTENCLELSGVLHTTLVASNEVLDTLDFHLCDGETWSIGSDSCFGVHALREVQAAVTEIVQGRGGAPELPPEPPPEPPSPAMQLAHPQPAARVA